MAGEQLERVIVTVGDGHLPSIQSVADALRQAGMQVGQVSPTIGTISGEVSPSKRQALTGIDGVVGVDPDEEMHAI